MEGIIKFETISQFNADNNHETLHPLVTVIDFSKVAPRRLRRAYFGFYLILIKDVECGDLRYGKHTYDYQEGTIIFIGPGQMLGTNGGPELYQPKGYGIAFHPDLIKGTYRPPPAELCAVCHQAKAQKETGCGYAEETPAIVALRAEITALKAERARLLREVA